MNTGGKLKIVAGISNCRVAVWHYVDGPWNGDAAVAVYKGPVVKALRGEEKSYIMVEDNDPVGYKSGKAVSAKGALNISAIQFPKYSPDLNPMTTSCGRRLRRGCPRTLRSGWSLCRLSRHA